MSVILIMGGIVKPNTRGFTLVEVMIAVGIIGVISAGVATMAVNMQKETLRFKVQSSKEAIRNDVRALAVGSTVFKKGESRPENSFLTACFDNATTSTCMASQWRAYTLVDGAGVPLGGANVFFDADRAPCPNWNGYCLFKVVTEVKPNCPNGASSCAEAESISLKLNIDVHPNSKIVVKPVLGEIVNADIIALRTGAITMQCPIGFSVVGYSSDGSIKCEKKGLASISCPTGYYVNGFDSNGSPICIADAVGNGGGGGGDGDGDGDGDGGVDGGVDGGLDGSCGP